MTQGDIRQTFYSLGRTFFGVATMASGVLQLVIGDFVRLMPLWPAWIPGQSVWARAVGLVLVAVGLAILTGRRARAALAVLAAMVLVNVVFIYPRHMVSNPLIDRPLLRGFMYTNPLKSLALVGGAALLASRLTGQWRPLDPLVRGLLRLEPHAATLLAAFLAVCGFQHFWYAQFVQRMVPSWIPPGQLFWTYFTGVALMAGGVGTLVRPTARLAASLSALMIFMWVWLLHIPRALAGPNHANETAGLFEALALSGVALLVAATRPRADGETSPDR